MRYIVKKQEKELKQVKIAKKSNLKQLKKANICNQCGDTFFKKEMRYLDKVDGPYCIYCVKKWDETQ